jgi:hypothetical protein
MSPMKKMKGSVLVQVLMTAVIVAIIAAGMMNLLLLRAQALKHAQSGAAGVALTNSGLDDILASWNLHRTSCYNSVPDFTGGSTNVPPGNCSCQYNGSINGNTVSITVTGSMPNCSLSINATPPP